MLVLSRKKNESVVINDDITVVVVEIRGDKVRLGIEAPKESPVLQRQVFEAIYRDPNYRANHIRHRIDVLKNKIRDLQADLLTFTSGEPEV
jgi:carbon storage regulator